MSLCSPVEILVTRGVGKGKNKGLGVQCSK